MHKKRLKTAVKKSTKWGILFFLLLSVFFFLLLYSSNTFLDYFIAQTNNRFQVHQNTDRLVVRNFLLSLYPTAFFNNEVEQYPLISITVADKPLVELKKQVDKAVGKGYSASEDKEYVSAFLLGDSIGIKLHGTTQGNFIGKKKSWNIQTKDENFNLINPKQHHYLVPFFANYLADKLSLYHNNSELVNLCFNDNTEGVYWREEKINKNFLKERQLDDCVIIALNNNWIKAVETAEWAKVCQSKNLKRNSKEKMEQAVAEYNKLIAAIESGNPDSILQYFDIDYLARFEAYRNILGVCHDIIGDNLRMYFNNSTQQFFPIVRSEGDLNKLQVNNGSLWYSYNSYGDDAVQQHHYLRLFKFLADSPQFVKAKNEHLAALLKNEQKILEDCKKIVEENFTALCYDRNDYHSIREKKMILPTYLATLKHNLALIKKVQLKKW